MRVKINTFSLKDTNSCAKSESLDGFALRAVEFLFKFGLKWKKYVNGLLKLYIGSNQSLFFLI